MTPHQQWMRHIGPHLAAGEKVVMAQPQNRWGTLPGGHATNMFAWLGAAFLLALGVPLLVGHASGRTVLLGLVSLGALVGLPIVAAQRARGRVLAMTTQRLLVVQGGRVQSIALAEIRHVAHREHHGGMGTLHLEHGAGSQVRADTYRGIEEVTSLARAIQLAVTHGAVDADTPAKPFFRRELDEGHGGAGRIGCMLVFVIVPLCGLIMLARGGEWLCALGAFAFFWLGVILVARPWLGMQHRAIHFLEVTEAGIVWRTHHMDFATLRLNEREQRVAFAELEAITLTSPLESGAVQRLTVAGQELVVPGHLLGDSASIRRFVETVRHYAPHVRTAGNVAILQA